MTRSPLRITLQGSFSVERDGEVVPERAWRLRKARSLVKLLALAPDRRVHRDVATEALWPDRDADAGANNLHQALHAARRALGDPTAITLAGGILALEPGVVVDLDELAAVAAAAMASGDPALLRDAVARHRLEPLPEDRYEPWAQPARDAVQGRFLELSVRAADAALAAGDPSAAVDALQPALAAAPLHEPAHRALMRAHRAAGRRQDALAQFEHLRTELRRELGADPDPETRALYRELLAGDAPEAVRPPALPVHLTSFVGRARELGELDRLLHRARLVTLTGPGGVGKTRLALEAAAALDGCAEDGVVFADLGGLREPGLVAQAVATAAGAPIPARRPALESLIAHLARRETLLILDTCEHLIDACAALAEALLRGAPGLRIMATSREPLRCQGETTWRVPSLAEAAVLFEERAAAAAPDVRHDPAVVEAICDRLDGMPLAVELAAAQAHALSAEQIAARLGDALDVLGAGQRTGLTRQATLRGAIDWSHDLLSGEERVVFRRLAVFAGGFTLEAAEDVCAGGAITGRRIAGLVARLVDQSLVVPAGERFRMLDTIRQYGAERLESSGEAQAVRLRHLDWCLGLAETHDPMLASGATRSLRRLEDDHDNLRAALSFALRADPQAALALATRAWRFWLDRSWFDEGTRWMDAVLAAAPEDTALRVEALLAAASLALRRGTAEAYLGRVQEAVRAYEVLGDQRATAEALHQHAAFEETSGSSQRAEALFDDAIALAERAGTAEIAASAVHASAMVPWFRSQLPIARERLEETLRRLDALPASGERFFQGITFGMVVSPVGPDGALRLIWEETLFLFHRFARDQAAGLTLANLAWVLRREGEPDAAHAALREALERFRRLDDRSGEALVLAALGQLARSTGDIDGALANLEASLALRTALGERREVGMSMLGIAGVHAATGDLERARSGYEAALARFEASDDAPAMAGTNGNWGIVEERAGDPERAADLLAAGADVWDRQRSPRFAGWLRIARGCALRATGDEEEAQRSWASARATLAAKDDPLGVEIVDELAALSAR